MYFMHNPIGTSFEGKWLENTIFKLELMHSPKDRSFRYPGSIKILQNGQSGMHLALVNRNCSANYRTETKQVVDTWLSGLNKHRKRLK